MRFGGRCKDRTHKQRGSQIEARVLREGVGRGEEGRGEGKGRVEVVKEGVAEGEGWQESG